MTYGVVLTGFQRKPLPITLAEIEAQLVTEFGPAVVQTPQSPLGTINGVFADFITELWEHLEDVYQSYDPDQAEGMRLDILAKLRLLQRAGSESDESLRQAITNADRARNDIQDIARAVRGLPGVTYTQVFVNDSDMTDENGMGPGAIAVAVLGGDPSDIATAMRQYIVPGVSTFGNISVSTNIDGFCRSLWVVRPILIPVKLDIVVRMNADQRGCPPPSLAAIKEAFMLDINGPRAFINGEDVSYFKVRSSIETLFSNVEVVSIVGERDGLSSATNSPVDIKFLELATLSFEDVTVSS